MRYIKRELEGVALGLLVASATAAAQQAPAEPKPAPRPCTDLNDTSKDCPPVSQLTTQPEESPPPDTPTPPPPPSPTPPSTEHVVTRNYGLSLSIGGGFTDYVSTRMRRLTDIGGSWDVRMTVGTHSYVAGEASYIGTMQSVSSARVPDSVNLVGNGAQLALRLNGTRGETWQPFIYGGAAWVHYELQNFHGSDDVYEFPVGLGLAWYGGHIYGGQFVVDLRAEYRGVTSDNKLIPEVLGPTSDLDRFGVTVNFGFSF